MRKIKKQAPPADLARYVRNENPQKFEDIHHTTNYPDLYDECIVQLEIEQENLSGYTEKPLAYVGRNSVSSIGQNQSLTSLLN